MLNFGDGFGKDNPSFRKASEDFVMVENKHYKLDVTHMDYDKNNYLAEKKLKTTEEDW